MAYLNAPILDIQLPGFNFEGMTDASGKPVTMMEIPFDLPLGISANSIDKVKCYIYNEIGTLLTTGEATYTGGQVASFVFPTAKAGKFYKIRLSFVQGETEGQLSNIAVIKCIKRGSLSVSFDNMEQSCTINYSTHLSDPTENLLYYQVSVYSTAEDRANKQNALEISKQLPYKLNEINKYKFKSYYTAKNGNAVIYYVAIELWTKNQYNTQLAYSWNLNYVNSSNINPPLITPHHETGMNAIIVNNGVYGGYLKRRSLVPNNENNWENIGYITAGNQNSSHTYYDKTVEAGIPYAYGVFFGNSTNTYKPVISPYQASVNFEDMFLLDASGRQLCIKFNPQVSTFKTVILEQKVDTIGNKFPFVFQNGDVEYKELALSGLISYEMDRNATFFDVGQNITNNYNRLKTPATYDVTTSPNKLAEERRFKLEVEKWLRNGEPKLLRSPTEGNYIVILMNVSLSPSNELGRMLHSFSATAYEIADCNAESMSLYGFI